MIENVELCIKIGGKPANFRGLTSKNSDFTTTSGECLTAADDERDCSRLCDGVIDLYCLEQGRRLSENGTQDTGKHHSDHSLYGYGEHAHPQLPEYCQEMKDWKLSLSGDFCARVISVCKHHADPSNASVSEWASCRAGNSAASIAPLWSKNRPADATPGSSKNISGIVIDLGKPAVHAMAAFWGALGSSVVVGGTKALLFALGSLDAPHRDLIAATSPCWI